MRLSCIVEGHGEVEAVPNLIHRIFEAINSTVPSFPSRFDAFGISLPGKIQAGANGGVFIIADADDDCAAELGQTLLTHARKAAGHAQLAVTLACREFESWFLAATESSNSPAGPPLRFAASNASYFAWLARWLNPGAVISASASIFFRSSSSRARNA